MLILSKFKKLLPIFVLGCQSSPILYNCKNGWIGGIKNNEFSYDESLKWNFLTMYYILSVTGTFCWSLYWEVAVI